MVADKENASAFAICASSPGTQYSHGHTSLHLASWQWRRPEPREARGDEDAVSPKTAARADDGRLNDFQGDAPVKQCPGNAAN